MAKFLCFETLNPEVLNRQADEAPSLNENIYRRVQISNINPARIRPRVVPFSVFKAHESVLLLCLTEYHLVT